jgi:hypothetical protein
MSPSSSISRCSPFFVFLLEWTLDFLIADSLWSLSTDGAFSCPLCEVELLGREENLFGRVEFDVKRTPFTLAMAAILAALFADRISAVVLAVTAFADEFLE